MNTIAKYRNHNPALGSILKGSPAAPTRDQAKMTWSGWRNLTELALWLNAKPTEAL
jgi:hypothetical protein